MNILIVFCPLLLLNLQNQDLVNLRQGSAKVSAVMHHKQISLEKVKTFEDSFKKLFKQPK